MIKDRKYEPKIYIIRSNEYREGMRVLTVKGTILDQLLIHILS